VRLLLLGLAVAALVYLVSGGHVLFLPLLLLPLGGALFGSRRARRSRRR
jgi:hypothetical protein